MTGHRVPNELTVQFGGLDRAELYLALGARKVAMNAFAAMLFTAPHFMIPAVPVMVTVRLLTPYDLGTSTAPTLEEIVGLARPAGLASCPLALAPFLRLEWVDREDGRDITVVSERAFPREDHPRGFYLRGGQGGPWLRGYRATVDWRWSQDSPFLFMVLPGGSGTGPAPGRAERERSPDLSGA